MRIQLWPDRDITVQKIRIENIPTLVLWPANRPSVDIGLLWIHGGGYITGMKEMV